jgi:phosphate transport system permease protein
MTFIPASPNDEFAALPMQIFYWAGHANRDFHDVAAAAIIVLLTVLILMNATAVYLRYHYGKRIRW